MEYSESSEKVGVKVEDSSYNDELDLIFKDINDFSHHDPTITYNDPLLDISNTQIGNKVAKVNNNFESFSEPRTEGPLKSEDSVDSKGYSNHEIESNGLNINSHDASKVSFIKDDAPRENMETIGKLVIDDSFKSSFKKPEENINTAAPFKRKNNENHCVECGEDCEDWIQMLAHVCKNKPQEHIKPLKKKSNHRSVIVITDDVDENGKAIEYKVRLQDVNNNANEKETKNIGLSKNGIELPTTKPDVNGVGSFYPRGYVAQTEYPCNECDRVFKRVCNLTQHKKAAHLGVHYSCNQCGELFKSSKMLLVHMNQIHDSYDSFQPLKLASRDQFLNETTRLEINALNQPGVMANEGNGQMSMNSYARLSTTKAGFARVPTTKDGYARAPTTKDGYARAPTTKDGYARVPTTKDGYARAPTSQNWSQNRPPLFKSKTAQEFPLQQEWSSFKETEAQPVRNHGHLKFVPESTGGVKYSPDPSLGAFLSNLSATTGTTGCEGVGPHLHVEGRGVDGIPILQSCKAPSIAQTQSGGYLDATRPLLVSSVQSFKPQNSTQSSLSPYIPSCGSQNAGQSSLALYTQSSRSQNGPLAPRAPYAQSFISENAIQHSTQVAPRPQAAPRPVCFTQKASVQTQASNLPGTVFQANKRLRPSNGPRKGPWSVSGSLPYLRISLCSG